VFPLTNVLSALPRGNIREEKREKTSVREKISKTKWTILSMDDG
jgi:hypothetical protein